MSTDVQPSTGQAPATARGNDAAARGVRPEPPSLVQESIKYRRRAQEAERRAEALEQEVQELRASQDQRATALEADLAATRAETQALQHRLDQSDRQRALERELLRAGCLDVEAGLAVSLQRLGDAPLPEDLAALVRGLLDEKPHLRRPASAAGPTAAGLPPPTAAARSAPAPRRAADRLADQARTTGSPADLMAYMKARRAGDPKRP